jgi:hypothetical protein
MNYRPPEYKKISNCTPHHHTSSSLPLPPIRLYTVNYTKERLKFEIGTFVDYVENEETGEYVEARRYYDLALSMLQIGAYHPRMVQFYEIHLSDLSHELIHNLYQLPKLELDFVLKQAAEAIFEDINARLYHDSISKVLKVRLVR